MANGSAFEIWLKCSETRLPIPCGGAPMEEGQKSMIASSISVLQRRGWM